MIRKIQLIRNGNVVDTVDFYTFFMNGKKDFSSIKLIDGDVIHIPTIQRRVSISGSVIRPSSYELLKNETFTDLLRYANGLTPKASSDILVNKTIPLQDRLSDDNAFTSVATNFGKIESIDFENNLVKVLGKRNKERLIPLSLNMVNGLKDFIKNYHLENFLFSNLDGKKLYAKLIYRVVKKYIGKISSVNKKSPHILRHTFATHMLNNGADINAIKELLGHANLSATQVYTHNTIQKLKSVYKQAHPRA